MSNKTRFSPKSIRMTALLSAGFAATAWAAAAATPPGEAAVQEVIVTGTRVTGLKASDSAAPIQILGSDTFKSVGQPDLVQALAQTLPSVQAQSFGTDQAALHPEIKLRGMNPNHTLVLIDGKRRHGTANIVVNGGIFLGAASADISLIPESAIDHIEVLQDGAAAQYGTDAIAGVVNIILKKASSGASVDITGGEHMSGGGASYDMMGNIGFSPAPNSFLNLTIEHKYADYTFRGDLDPRVVDNGVGTGQTGNSGRNLLALFPKLASAQDYPYVNRIVGNPTYTQTNGSFNAGYDITPDLQVYSFGTYSARTGRAYENYRLPNAAFGKSPTDFPFPLGFSPQEVTYETDYAVTGGLKGEVAGTTFDLSSTYGSDNNQSYVDHTADLSLYYDTSNFVTNANGSTTYVPGYTPTYIHNGNFLDSQWTTTLDLSHAFNLGLAEPVEVAGGVEYRKENYTLQAGDPASYYTGTGKLAAGTQGFFGYTPHDAGSHDRDDLSEYLDIHVTPIKNLVFDGAIRHENYSDFGAATVEKITGRYDFSPAFAIRGTAATGFRAPTLAEEFYSGVNVSTSTVGGIFAPNSAGAAFLGLHGLKPEKSTNFSVGFVAHPAPRLTMTVDAYQIELRDRIIQSGAFTGYSSTSSAIISPSVLTALTAAGVSTDPVIAVIKGPPAQSGSITVQTFVNGATTMTRGIDAVVTYSSNFDSFGRVNWSLAANYNDTEITKIAAPPSNVNPAAVMLDLPSQANLTKSTPKYRVTAGALWNLGKFGVNLRESYYGSTYGLAADLLTSTLTYDKIPINPAFITDLDVSYRLFSNTKLSFGANNLFNTYPTKYPAYYRNEQYIKASTGYVTIYPTFSPFGINGGYYYGRLSLTW
jgi:iron complex outermembrane receptor protein